jgi:hypothetical protein
VPRIFPNRIKGFFFVKIVKQEFSTGFPQAKKFSTDLFPLLSDYCPSFSGFFLLRFFLVRTIFFSFFSGFFPLFFKKSEKIFLIRKKK